MRVDGFEPRAARVEFLRRITLVMGQKQQLLWDLPPVDTFAMNRAIYDVPQARVRRDDARARRRCSSSATLVKRPTRQLSLGERMKCELAAALLHGPRVLFLDEPTIGLDVSMQATLRDFIRGYNERFGATVLLTSHYMDDVAALCPRVIVIDKGQLTYDGALGELVRKVRPHKRVIVRLTDGKTGDARRGRRPSCSRRITRLLRARRRRSHRRGSAARGGDARALRRDKGNAA